jgi:hypothetical protein
MEYAELLKEFNEGRAYFDQLPIASGNFDFLGALQ